LENVISLCKIVFDFEREDVSEPKDLEGVYVLEGRRLTHILMLIYFG